MNFDFYVNRTCNCDITGCRSLVSGCCGDITFSGFYCCYKTCLVYSCYFGIGGLPFEGLGSSFGFDCSFKLCFLSFRDRKFCLADFNCCCIRHYSDDTFAFDIA